MEEHRVKIISKRFVTHDVLQIVTEKPSGYSYQPGQATDVSINRDGWREELRPFTFTSLPNAGYLEFTTKTYPERKSVTNEFINLKEGDELILHEVFGAITYKGEGVFIAGGAGVTPFICIFRDLQKRNEIGDNKLIFANKTSADIIHEFEFRGMLGKNFINILSEERSEDYAHGFLTGEFLMPHVNQEIQHFYVCGPPPMMEAVDIILTGLGINRNIITVEL